MNKHSFSQRLSSLIENNLVHTVFDTEKKKNDKILINFSIFFSQKFDWFERGISNSICVQVLIGVWSSIINCNTAQTAVISVHLRLIDSHIRYHTYLYVRIRIYYNVFNFQA